MTTKPNAVPTKQDNVDIRQSQRTSSHIHSRLQLAAAVHEAGHAIAMLIASSERGYGFEDAVEYIEMGRRRVDPGTDPNGRYRTGLTAGPFFSRDIDDVADQCKTEAGPPRTDWRNHASRLLAASKTRGVDVPRWYRAFALTVLGGPVAEAIFLETLLSELRSLGTCEGDYTFLSDFAEAAGISNQRIKRTDDKMAAFAAFVFGSPYIWPAVLSLAKSLPIDGRVPGREIVSIVSSQVAPATLRNIFSDGLEFLRKIRNLIAAEDIVIARLPSGDEFIVKGVERVQRLRRGQCDSAEFLDCPHLVSAETLWRAFGDAAKPNGPTMLTRLVR